MMNRPTPAFDRALGYLKAGLSTKRWPTLLPSISMLAEHAGVGLITMWKAVRALRDGGMLDVTHGTGVRVATAPISRPDAAADFADITTRERWRSCVAAIKSDILNSVLHAGEPLPSTKQMCARYRVSYPTMRRALSHLHGECILTPDGRGYAVPGLNVTAGNADVVLLTWGEEFKDASFSPWQRTLIQSLEQECVRTRLTLHRVRYFGGPGGVMFRTVGGVRTRMIPVRPSTLGCIIDGLDGDGSFPNALVAACATGRRVVRSGYTPELTKVNYASKPEQLRQVQIADNAIAGRIVAENLLMYGHRRVVYISPLHGTDWSGWRFEGLRRHFETAGVTDGARLISTPLRLIDELLEMVKPSFLSAALQTNLFDFRKEFEGDMDSPIRHAIRSMMLRRFMAPLLNRATEDREVTAWVCCNDHIGLLALQHLRSIGQSNRISVIGFDNTFDALNGELASYDFNVGAAARVIMGHLLTGETTERFELEKPVVIKGMVVPRESLKVIRR